MSKYAQSTFGAMNNSIYASSANDSSTAITDETERAKSSFQSKSSNCDSIHMRESPFLDDSSSPVCQDSQEAGNSY